MLNVKCCVLNDKYMPDLLSQQQSPYDNMEMYNPQGVVVVVVIVVVIS